MPLALIPDAALVDGALVADAVVVDGARIAAVVCRDAVPAGVERVELPGTTLVPGFVDTQVNGGGGVLFNDEPTVEGIAAIGAAHRRFGTTGFLPTLISDEPGMVRRAVAAVDAAIAAGVPGVLGIHIEGPFLNPQRRGIHAERHVRPLDEEGFATITALKRGRTLVTLAPESVGPDAIRRLADAGVVIAAGHTDGTYEQVRAGLEAGVTGFTHLFNAMSPLASRAPGAVGAALEGDAWCGLIADGHHVDPVAMRLAYRLKGPERLMLVSDAMPSVGAATKDFVLQGQPVHVSDGICRGADGTLAGADLDMAGAVRNAQAMLGIGLSAAAAMASSTPAAFLGLGDRLGCIAPGFQADLVALSAEGTARRVWTAGRELTVDDTGGPFVAG